MKKITYLFIAAFFLSILSLGVASCGDNTDFSKAHILTDAEMAELARQKHIADSLAQVINADTIQYVEIEDYVAPDGIWSTKPFEIDIKMMAEAFELTEDQVVAALCQAPDAPEFTNVVIQGTTHMDQATNANNRTNGLWGHWYKYNGNATESSYAEEDSRFFTEWAGYYDTDENVCVEPYFNIGQFPGRSVAGDHYQAIECFIYGDHRMAIVIDYKVIERQAVVGGVVATHELSMQCEYNGSYATTPVEFDLNGLLSELGAPSWSDISWVGIKADGSYDQVMTAGDAVGNEGFWFDQNGNPGSWGDSASVFACFPTQVETNTFTVAPMPDVFTVGNSVTLHFAAVYGDKIVEYHLFVEMVAAAAIEGNVVYKAEYTVKQSYRNDYSYSLLTVDADAICKALGIDNLGNATGIAKDGNGNYSKDYCADGQGFWYCSDGSFGYGELCVIYIARILSNDPDDEAYSTLRIGMIPKDDPSVLEPISVVYAYQAGDKIAEITINWSLGDADEGFTEAHDYAKDILAATNVGNVELAADCAWNTDFEGALLEFDSDAVKAALGTDDLTSVLRYVLQPDGTVAYQEDPAYWCGADGSVTGFNENGRIFVAYYGYDPEWPEDEYLLYLGLMPPSAEAYTCRVGDIYNVTYGLYYKGKTYTFKVKATVTGEETPLTAPASKPKSSVNLRKTVHSWR